LSLVVGNLQLLNLLTIPGQYRHWLINLSIPTMYISDWWAMLILVDIHVRYVQLHGILGISAYGDFNCPQWYQAYGCDVHAPFYFLGRVIQDRKINTARRVAHSTITKTIYCHAFGSEDHI